MMEHGCPCGGMNIGHPRESSLWGCTEERITCVPNKLVCKFCNSNNSTFKKSNMKSENYAVFLSSVTWSILGQLTCVQWSLFFVDSVRGPEMALHSRQNIEAFKVINKFRKKIMSIWNVDLIGPIIQFWVLFYEGHEVVNLLRLCQGRWSLTALWCWN